MLSLLLRLSLIGAISYSFVFFSREFPKSFKQTRIAIALTVIIYSAILLFLTGFLTKREFSSFFSPEKMLTREMLLVILAQTVLYSYVLMIAVWQNGVGELLADFLSTFQTFQGLKKNLLAPFVEELVYRLSFHLLFDRESKLENFLFVFGSTLCFSLSHPLGRGPPAILGLYTSVVLLKTESIFGPVFLHSSCNILGGPPRIPTEFSDGRRRFLKGVLIASLVSVPMIIAFI